MDIVNWTSILESLLFAAGDEGLTLKEIAKIMEIEEFQARDILEDLKKEYARKERGITIVELAGTYQLATKKENSLYLKRLVEVPSHTNLSQAALETLTIIAYKQPITRAEIEDIRGVKSERPLQTLLARGLIREVDRLDGPGRAILYGTTKEFLDYFGLKDLNELPPLPEGTEEWQKEADLFFDDVSVDR
ncbi:MAG: SMC-Scp complex subunit ScpB [Caldibacillus sp.]